MINRKMGALLGMVCLAMIDCAAGSTDASLSDSSDAGTDAMTSNDAAVVQGETVCSPEGMGCGSDSECCSQPYGMICAAHVGYGPVCRVICVTDFDCSVPGSSDTCQHVIGQEYGACEPQ